ncbi:hypothetical protein KBD18_01490, partial [Patescibacteria group bacterium]|nr:hypothetical protein [Patescibacteria group bacterium]
MNTPRRQKGTYQKSRAMAMPAQQSLQGIMVPLVLLGTLALLVVAYVVLMNAMTQKSFELKKVGGLVSELEHDGKRLEVTLAQHESMTNLADRIATLGMVPTEKVDYVNT